MGKKKDNYAVSEYRDSSDMNEGKYICAPPMTHDWYTMADLGAPDKDLDLDMALYVDELGSEGLARIGEKVEEDGREGRDWEDTWEEDSMEEPQEAEGEEPAELVDNEEANFLNSDQSWNWWSKEIPDETVELKEHANAGYKESVADRLLAAWTTVKPAM